MGRYLIYLAFAVAFLAAFILYFKLSTKRENNRLIKQIKEDWGRDPLRTTKPALNTNVPYYHRTVKEKYGFEGFLIDDITWNDLEMDVVYQYMNNTCSSVGEQYLYHILRCPLFDKKELEEREKILSFFQTNRKVRLDLQLLLTKLGKVPKLDITMYLSEDFRSMAEITDMYKYMAALLLLSPLLLLVDVSFGIFAIIAMLFINMTVYYKKKGEIESHLEAFNYIVSFIDCADKMSQTEIPELKEQIDGLRGSLKNLKTVVRKSFMVLYNSENPIMEYVKVIFLGELIAFQSMFKTILKHNRDLVKVYEITGLIDSMISVAAYRARLDYFTRPQFKEDPKSLSFDEIYHPLLIKPVSNSLSIEGPILITGSNASGKSTFLKTVAINAIFAQTINTCFARKYVTSFFTIYTSMAMRDDIISGESYYITEIKSLKRILDSISDKVPCLCFIDEVLRGTNTIERISASSELLHHLSESNAIPMVATHDLELSRILSSHYISYHFQEYVTDNDIVFDYKIYPGKSNTRNAIKLLRLMGYGENLVVSSEERACYFIENGSWPKI